MACSPIPIHTYLHAQFVNMGLDLMYQYFMEPVGREGGGGGMNLKYPFDSILVYDVQPIGGHVQVSEIFGVVMLAYMLNTRITVK